MCDADCLPMSEHFTRAHVACWLDHVVLVGNYFFGMFRPSTAFRTKVLEDIIFGWSVSGSMLTWELIFSGEMQFFKTFKILLSVYRTQSTIDRLNFKKF